MCEDGPGVPKIQTWRVSEGEEARLTPEGPAAAEIVSRGPLPLRVRTEGVPRLRPAFPGTAVVLGDRDYEVVDEIVSGGAVTYRLRPWPPDHVVRDRVVYGPRLVMAARAERRRAHERERARSYAWLLSPLVGLLPEPEQELLCDRLGLDAVSATLVSGVFEGFAAVWLASLLARHSSEAGGVGLVLSAPVLVLLLVVPAFGRSSSAWAFRETGGCWLVVLGFDLARALRLRRERLDQTVVPLTRVAFWSRLQLPDRLEREADGSVLVRGLLPHLSWSPARRLQAPDGYWAVVTLPPALERGRLVYRYRLTCLAANAPSPDAAPLPPRPTTYGDEVLAGVRREWEDLLHGFSWLVSMLPERVQKRALAERGGPAAIRRAAMLTALATVLVAAYLLRFVMDSKGDPLAPVVGLGALALLADGGLRLVRVARGRYAPSLLSLVLPCDALRPERLAYHAHRDAEREALRALTVR